MGIDFSCNEMLRDNLRNQNSRFASEINAYVYTYTGDNSAKKMKWERVTVAIDTVVNSESMNRSTEELEYTEENYNSEISIQGEFKDESLIQDYYNGIFNELTSRNDVIAERTYDGTTSLILPNGVIMEFQADGVDEESQENYDDVRGFKKAWKKVKTIVKKNKPRVIGALVFGVGAAIGYFANSFPDGGQILAYISAACFMYSGKQMMKKNVYYMGCKFEKKLNQ